MISKEELELLRDGAIEVKVSADLVPCRETSSFEHLCKHPVVSVHMITYNHEDYIRQAIEGVMMQETNFEFELVIGEDCSQDRTRDICFEYQAKYPDKIRVLWSDRNVNDIGGNSTRVFSRCRGEFIAFCEGDDYWIDKHKLQKQVEVLRSHPTVGLCGGFFEELDEKTGSITRNSYPLSKSGFCPREEFLRFVLFGLQPKTFTAKWLPFQTASVMCRKSVLEAAEKAFADLYSWKLRLQDCLYYFSLACLSDVYFMEDVVSVYRKHGGGATGQYGSKLALDASVISIKIISDFFGLDLRDAISANRRRVFHAWLSCARAEEREEQIALGRKIAHSKLLRKVFFTVDAFPVFLLLWVGLYEGIGVEFAQFYFRAVQKIKSFFNSYYLEKRVDRVFVKGMIK